MSKSNARPSVRLPPKAPASALLPPRSSPVGTIRFLSQEEVCDLAGVPYITLYRWMRAGRFPAGRVLSGKPKGRHVKIGWLESEVVEWAKSRPRRELPIKSPSQSDR